jgi:hypothetical protein
MGYSSQAWPSNCDVLRGRLLMTRGAVLVDFSTTGAYIIAPATRRRDDTDDQFICWWDLRGCDLQLFTNANLAAPQKCLPMHSILALACTACGTSPIVPSSRSSDLRLQQCCAKGYGLSFAPAATISGRAMHIHDCSVVSCHGTPTAMNEPNEGITAKSR